MCACVTAELFFRSFSARICYLRWPKTVTSKPNAHSKLQIVHCKLKALTANSNRSQQIQIAHNKCKLSRSQQIQGSAYLSRVEGIFSSVEGTLSRVPILQRGNLIIKLS